MGLSLDNSMIARVTVIDACGHTFTLTKMKVTLALLFGSLVAATVLGRSLAISL